MQNQGFLVSISNENEIQVPVQCDVRNFYYHLMPSLLFEFLDSHIIIIHFFIFSTTYLIGFINKVSLFIRFGTWILGNQHQAYSGSRTLLHLQSFMALVTCIELIRMTISSNIIPSTIIMAYLTAFFISFTGMLVMSTVWCLF